MGGGRQRSKLYTTTFSTDRYELMKYCWKFSPEERPTFRYCLEVLRALRENTSEDTQIIAPFPAKLQQGRTARKKMLSHTHAHTRARPIFEHFTLSCARTLHFLCALLRNQANSFISLQRPLPIRLTWCPKVARCHHCQVDSLCTSARCRPNYIQNHQLAPTSTTELSLTCLLVVIVIVSSKFQSWLLIFT